MGEETPRTGLSRRELIRRGAIVGGAAWSVPVIQSLASPAFAAGSDPHLGRCDRLIYLKWAARPYGSYWLGSESSANHSCYDNLVADLSTDLLGDLQAPIPPVQPATFLSQSQTQAVVAGVGTLQAIWDATHDCVTIVAPDNARIVTYQVKTGTRSGCAANSSAPQSLPFPKQVTACGSGAGHGFSHIGLILCVNS